MKKISIPILFCCFLLLFVRFVFAQEETGWITLEGQPGLTRVDVKFHLCTCSSYGCNGYPKYEEISTHTKVVSYTYSYECADCDGKVKTVKIFNILKPGEHAHTPGMWHFCKKVSNFKLISFKEEGAEPILTVKNNSTTPKSSNNQLKETAHPENTGTALKTTSTSTPNISTANNKTTNTQTNKTVVSTIQNSNTKTIISEQQTNKVSDNCGNKFDVNGNNWKFTKGGEENGRWESQRNGNILQLTKYTNFQDGGKEIKTYELDLSDNCLKLDGGVKKDNSRSGSSYKDGAVDFYTITIQQNENCHPANPSGCIKYLTTTYLKDGTIYKRYGEGSTLTDTPTNHTSRLEIWCASKSDADELFCRLRALIKK